jgi:hypothetical protein
MSSMFIEGNTVGDEVDCDGQRFAMDCNSLLECLKLACG